MRTLAIIPARGGSKRIPQKNIRPLCGKPLIGWTIDFALSIAQFDHVHVSTDSADIQEACAAMGFEVPFLRSAATATDTASSASAAIEVLNDLEEAGEHFDLVALLQPTSPWRQARHWDEAFEMLDRSGCDSVVSAMPTRHHPFHAFRLDADGSIDYLFDERSRHSRSQDLPPAFCLNGSLYLSRTTTIRSSNSMIGGNCRCVTMTDMLSNIDIDTPEDWVLAERLYSESVS